MILSTAMMLDYLGEKETALKINKAVENIVAKGKVLTPDLGGKAKTIEMTEAILKEVI